jgi:nucleoside-diphosphate-sugar epimerase
MILVTGANGFVGRALCEHLHARGIPFRPAARWPIPGGVAVGDLSVTTDWTKALVGVSVIVHLAARVHMLNDRASDPLAAFRALNVDATLNMAAQARRAGVKRIVYLSSVKVNGEWTAPGQPFFADDAPAPQDPYGQSKLEAERGLLDEVAQRGLEVVVVRPPLIYGPGVKANFRVMMNWVRRGIPLPLGGIRNRRSLVALSNIVDLIVVCTSHPGAVGQIFLVSDGEDLSTTDLLSRIAHAMGRSRRLVSVPEALLWGGAAVLGKRAVAQRLLGSLQLDINKTRQRLGWNPPITVEVALAETVERFLRDSVDRQHI